MQGEFFPAFDESSSLAFAAWRPVPFEEKGCQVAAALSSFFSPAVFSGPRLQGPASVFSRIPVNFFTVIQPTFMMGPGHKSLRFLHTA
jgi:hypothetical protein